jgi:integrase
MTIGKYPAYSLSEARNEATNAKTTRDKGGDPAQIKQEEKREGKAAPTVQEFGQEYIERWARPNKKSWQEDQRLLTKEVYPVIGKMKLAKVRRRDVIQVIDRVKDRGAEVQANRVLACVRRMFNFAVERGAIEATPASHIKATREKARDRVLSREEIKTLYPAIDAADLWFGFKIAYKLILHTAQRPGEVRQMEHSEISRDEKLWIIPANKTKNGLSQTIPLTDTALELIDQMKASNDERWVIPSPRRQGPISSYGLAQGLRQITQAAELERVTPHDLRRTAATLITELGFNRLVVDKILNHKDQSVGGIYDRHSYDKEKRQALEAWERELERIFTGDNTQNKVIPLGIEK